MEGHGVEARHPQAVGVAGPATAALGEEDDREPLALGQLEEAVLLAVVLQALRAGEHSVVVRHDDDGVAVDGPGAADHPVGGGAGDELVELATPPLGGDHRGPVLDEAALVEEVGDVLAGGALAAAPPSLDGLGPGRVEPDLVPCPHLRQVGALRIGRRTARLARRRRGPAVARSGICCGPVARSPLVEGDAGQQVALLHRIALGDQQLRDDAGGGCLDRVLHLHRLDDDELAAGLHGLSHARREADDRALQGCAQLEHRGVSSPMGYERPRAHR